MKNLSQKELKEVSGGKPCEDIGTVIGILVKMIKITIKL